MLNRRRNMQKEESTKQEKCMPHTNSHNGMMGGAYGLAFIGAAVYFVQQADGFWKGVLGILKAMVWPAILIYKVFSLLNL